MKHRIILSAVLVLMLVFLASCGQQPAEPQYQVVQVTNVPDAPSQQAPASAQGSSPSGSDYNFDSGEYDPSSEEGVLDSLPGETPYVATVSLDPTPAPTMRSVYAGATPVLLDPIDKPTPTPVPPISFSNFATYDATKLGISFSAPAGWTVDDAANDTYVLVNPDTKVDYQATLTVYVYTLNSDYSQSDLAKEVRNALSTRKSQYDQYSPTNTATRTLLDKTGVYADFTGVLKSTGAPVGGRIHAVSLNKKLYILEMTWPKAYASVYKDSVYKQFRHTIKITK